MKLPNAQKARVEAMKVIGYLLSESHPDGRSKAAFFSSFGFGTEHWQDFAAALREHGRLHEIAEISVSNHGTRYCIDGTIKTPDGRNPRVRTVWIIDSDSGEPRLVTAYPIGRRNVQRT